MAELPLGYRFKPTNTQLVGYYLTYKLKGQPMPSPNPIMDYDVYSDHPFNILVKTKVKEDEKGGMEGYFFSRLTKANPKGKKISRCIKDHGTWSNKSTPKNVYDQAMTVIGKDRYFKFVPDEKKKNEHENNKEWKMHEYSISENDLVLCHITNKVDSSRDDVEICRRSKRSSDYEIGSSSKHGRVEYESPECTSTVIDNPPQDELAHQIMDYGFQYQQYPMPHHSLHRQFTIPHQEYTAPHGFPKEVHYAMPHGFPDQVQYFMPYEPHQQYTMPYKAMGDEHDGMITSDQPQVVQGGGMYCNDEQGATSLNYSLSECVNDNIQVPQQDYQIHNEQAASLPSGVVELSEEATLVEEIEGMLSDPHEALGEERYDEQDKTTNSEPYLVQPGEYFHQDIMQVQPEQIQINGIHQEQAFSMDNNVAQENTSWRFKYSSTAGCDYSANKLGFEHEDDDVDFSSWLPALVAA